MAKPNSYDTIIQPNIKKIIKAVKEGATEKSIYESLGISKSTWCEAKKTKPDFADLIAGARAHADIKIDNSIYKAARGYYTTETKTVLKQDKDGMPVEEVIKTKRWHEPNMTAAAIWKRNHSSDFRDKDSQAVEISERQMKMKERVAQDSAFGDLGLEKENATGIQSSKADNQEN